MEHNLGRFDWRVETGQVANSDSPGREGIERSVPLPGRNATASEVNTDPGPTARISVCVDDDVIRGSVEVHIRTRSPQRKKELSAREVSTCCAVGGAGTVLEVHGRSEEAAVYPTEQFAVLERVVPDRAVRSFDRVAVVDLVALVSELSDDLVFDSGATSNVEWIVNRCLHGLLANQIVEKGALDFFWSQHDECFDDGRIRG